jgi:anti-sigma B factor antagonist
MRELGRLRPEMRKEASVNLDIRKDKDKVIVSVSGRVDTLNAQDFQTRMEEVLDQGDAGIILDCSGLDYISSAGLRSILFAAKKARSLGGSLACCALHGMVKKVFDVSGLDTLIPVFDSVDEALHGN